MRHTDKEFVEHLDAYGMGIIARRLENVVKQRDELLATMKKIDALYRESTINQMGVLAAIAVEDIVKENAGAP